VPSFVLIVLAIFTGSYIVIVAVAAFGVSRAQQTSEPDAPSPPPDLSVIVWSDGERARLDACLESLRACQYPNDQYEIIVVTDQASFGDAQASGKWSQEEPVIRLSERAPPQNTPPVYSRLEGSQATGEILLTIRADGIVPENWLQLMAAHCTPNTPVVTGPVTYQHEDRFLPRLQALEQVGLEAFSAGMTRLGMASASPIENGAVHRSVPSARGCCGPSGGDQAFLLNADAVISATPAGTLWEYVKARGDRIGTRRHACSGPTRVLETMLWGTHVVLLAACVVAIVTPSWRQPSLLALLGKMGVDILLAAPVARQWSQRSLLRSTVPTELFLLLFVPAAGVLSVWDRSEQTAVFSS